MTPLRSFAFALIAPLFAATAIVAAGEATAQSRDGYLAPMDGSSSNAGASTPRGERRWDRSVPAAGDDVIREALPTPVDKGDLQPVLAGDGSGLPLELWRGLDGAAFERLVGGLQIPPRSPALHALWKRLIASDAPPPSGAGAAFAAVRLEMLYQSGLVDDAERAIAKIGPTEDATLVALSARNELALNRTDPACENAAKAVPLKAQLPVWLREQVLLLSGYCAALTGDAASAGLAAEIAREAGVQSSFSLDALDALSVGSKLQSKPPTPVSLLDYRLAQKSGGLPAKAAIDAGEAALLVALANDPSTPADVGLLAAEAAARLNALSPDVLGAIYRVNAPPEATEQLLSGAASNGPLGRAAMFKAIETERTPMKKARLARALLDEARRIGLLVQAMQMIAPAAAEIAPQPEISWFAETGVEIALAAGRYADARRWIDASAQPGALTHWLALADIADPAYAQRGQSLSSLEPLAVSGRFAPDSLHRLATVLDALYYQVPIPLWDVANRSPQPAGGHLPETGVLSELQDAAKKQEFGRTVLLAMKALGPGGAERAHMIALGDAIRALKRAGLEADARRLGFEALFLAWPRSNGA